MFADGGTLPISQTHVPVQFDEIFQTFNPPTRRAIQDNLVGIGGTVAGRGSAVNDTLAALPALLGHLGPVARNLSDPSTRLTRLIGSLNTFMATVAPVAPVASRLFTDMATTFEAISRDPAALEDAIAESPSTLAVGTESLRVAQPLLSDLTTLGHALTPATAQLERTPPAAKPGDRGRHDHAEAHPGVQRGPPAAVERAEAPRASRRRPTRRSTG